MFRFLCRRHLALRNSTAHLGFPQNTFCVVRPLSSSLKAKENEEKQSFMVSYLMNSCGLSLKSANSASKKIKLTNTERANSVLRLLRDKGLSNTQISKVVRGCPSIIIVDPEKILLPKIEFFCSIGFSRNELAKIISSSPVLLSMSLKNHLTPNYNFLKNVLVRDDKIVKSLKRASRVFLLDLRSSDMATNIALLKHIGVTPSQISLLLTTVPSAACLKHSKFCKIINEVREMGFNTTKSAFVLAVGVINQLNKSVWDSKNEIYERWGWSKGETLAAFRKYPNCMLTSEEKITRAMDFFVNKMGCLPQDIAKMPMILSFSLEQRVAPRCSVIQVLLSQGLIKEDICPISYLTLTESKFIERYVTEFQEKVPKLLNVYQGKIDLPDVNPGFQRSVK